MSEITISVEKCDCGRSYCEYFDAGAGEWGRSYRRSDIEYELRDIPSQIANLESLKVKLEKLLEDNPKTRKKSNVKA